MLTRARGWKAVYQREETRPFRGSTLRPGTWKAQLLFTRGPASRLGAKFSREVAPDPAATAQSGTSPLPLTDAKGQFETGGASSGIWHRLGLEEGSLPGNAFPSPPLPRTQTRGEGGGVPRVPHQAKLANFVVGHKAEDVLDGYDGQRHQRVVLRQLVRSQRRHWGCLGPRLRRLGWRRWELSLSRTGSRRGAAVAVAAASFLSHPLLRRRRHLGSLIPSPTVRGTGILPARHFLLLQPRGGGT